MKLSRIYASKLYITNPRRDMIRAAIDSYANAELVQQLSEYLDSESREKLEEAIEEQQPKQEEVSEESGEMEFDEGSFKEDIPDEDNVFSPSFSGGGPSIPAPSNDEMGGEAGPDIFAEPEGEESAPEPAPAPDGAVEESTAIYGEVTACTQLEDSINKIAEDIEIIKGTLNSREDTSGIMRATIVEDELWIYYKDEVNIGDIMVNVIEVLNGTVYTNLSFSRLARSNNAIVFDINEVFEPVKSIEEIEETKK